VEERGKKDIPEMGQVARCGFFRILHLRYLRSALALEEDERGAFHTGRVVSDLFY
jgi:hypothetical protein